MNYGTMRRRSALDNVRNQVGPALDVHINGLMTTAKRQILVRALAHDVASRKISQGIMCIYQANGQFIQDSNDVSYTT
jgi:hypothetical protein